MKNIKLISGLVAILATVTTLLFTIFSNASLWTKLNNSEKQLLTPTQQFKSRFSAFLSAVILGFSVIFIVTLLLLTRINDWRLIVSEIFILATLYSVVLFIWMLNHDIAKPIYMHKTNDKYDGFLVLHPVNDKIISIKDPNSDEKSEEIMLISIDDLQSYTLNTVKGKTRPMHSNKKSDNN